MTGSSVGRVSHGAMGSGAATSLRFRVLGPLEVNGPSGPLTLGGPKQRIVLAHLIIRAGEVVSADALADALWADDPPDSSINVIQTYVSLLRRALGGDRIVGRSGGYVLFVGPAELDADSFDALVREARRMLPVRPEVAIGTLDDALALWRGRALSDVASDARLIAEASRLDEERLNARELRIEAMLAVGQDARAIAELESVVPDDPLRESLWVLRMRALYRQGRQSEALAAYQRVRRLLREELGIDPSPDLERLHRQILQQDPALTVRGQPLRGYRLLERLREDQGGVVFRALQPSVGRDVAIRVISGPEASDEDFVRDFERRLEAIAALEHPHIVPILDYWREDGQAYVVARYLRGGTLAGREARGEPIEGARAAQLIAELGSALAYAHERGVAHGAVSPDRVGLDAEGRAYLDDFRVDAKDPTPDASADVLALLALARRLSHGDDRLQERLQRLGDDSPEVTARDVVTAVHASLGMPAPTASAHSGARNPYKGLRPFGEVDAADFHGREQLVRRLLARLGEPGPQGRFLAVVGPSGSGKSSLVRAGLVPAIRSGALHPRERTFVSEMFPSLHPFGELEAALARVAVRGEMPLGSAQVADDRVVLDAVSGILPSDAELVLVVDQFEELFTMTTDASESARFVEALRVATADPASRVRVVVTLRADFYDRPLLFPRFGELLAARTEAIAPLAADELEAAIRRPAEAVGIRPEPGLVSAIVSDAMHQPGTLPMVQYALTEVFERQQGGTLRLADYQAIGTLGGAISARADEVLMTLDAPRREVARQAFLRLVTLGEGREDTRRRVARSELGSIIADESALDGVLEAYGRHRLLTFDRDPVTREPTVEIAHEALLTRWSRLRGWIDAAREELRQETVLARAAREWRTNDKDSSYLLHGARLGQLASWASTTSLVLSRPTQAYLHASLARRDADQQAELERQHREAALERRSRSRLRALVALFGVAAIVAGALSLAALDQADRAARESRIARARELAAASDASVAVDPERAILLAIEAVDVTRAADGTVVREAESALHRAISASRAVATLPAAGGAVDWGADGLIASAALEPGVIEIRDSVDWSVTRSIDAHDGAITDLDFSADGRLLASTGDDGRLRIWALAAAGPGASLEGIGPAEDISWSGDGRRVAATWADEEQVRVLDVLGATMVAEVPVVSDSGATVLSPDGRILIASAARGGRQVGLSFDVSSEPRGPGPIDLDVPLASVYGLAWSPDGTTVATAGLNGVDLWDGTTLEHRVELPRNASISVDPIAWNPDGEWLATGDVEDPTVQVFRADGTGVMTRLTSQETSLGINGLAFSPDGRRLVAGGDGGGAAKVWGLGADVGSEILSVPTIDEPGDVAFSADGRAIIAADARGRLRSWDLASGTATAPFGSPVAQHQFELSPDGTVLAMPLYGNGVAAWEVAGGRRLFRSRGLGWVDEVAWSHDGEHIVAVVHAPEARAIVLDRRGEVIASFADPDGSPYSARFAPGDRLVGVVPFPEEGGSVVFWDWQRDELVRRIPAEPAGIVAFSPDGATLATGFGVASLLDSTNGVPRVVLEGHPTAVADVAFSPDGSRVAVALAGDTTGGNEIRILDARSGQLQLVLDPDDGRFLSRIAFSPDGSMLASQATGLVRVWALDLDQALSIARQRLTRPPTEDECRRFRLDTETGCADVEVQSG